MRKGIFNIFFVYIYIFREQYTLEATSGQSWHNYIGPKRENPSLSNQPSLCTFSLKVAWSGISLPFHEGKTSEREHGSVLDTYCLIFPGFK